MNLEKLFEMQKVLDERIVKEKGLEGQDLLPNRILALQVELGELANEWQGFKFWKNNREPRITKESIAFSNPDGPFVHTTYPLLEEYVDCLHFILSIGLEVHIADDSQMDIVEIEDEIQQYPYRRSNITEQFQAMFYFSTRAHSRYVQLFNCFVQLGKMLGFTWEEIEAAYVSKNQVNHERQGSGY